ncbi:hypothetical protein PV396_17980 [Streptomyces sp. ME02-8801-2C]|uniref:hypothetical protein n=1 Tax=Streptomyces sp. ME02-8801-2C TaxID=3028680 RepID=UPI0029AC3E7F|nr:hypothetical protein [Streptomyces sp. ME02-8801-2C]MDX3453816.1 hypothetical protein [Streptomyces sp. ME02-8801-2C]
MQQHRAYPTRPAAVVLSVLVAVLTFLLPVSAKSASAARPSSTGTAAVAIAQASATADAQRPFTVARPVLGHADALPYPFPFPFHPFLGPGAGDAAPHRAVGGPAVGVAVADAEASLGSHAYRPRGPPS